MRTSKSDSKSEAADVP